MGATRRKYRYGEMAACKYCGQDIQFLGKWYDRGSNRKCCPFVRGGEIVRPETKHAPHVKTENL